jgi:transposase
MLMIDDLHILFYSDAIDMRKSIDSLCALITETLKRNPMEGTLFLFRNRSGNKIKALYYEANCFTIWYRRLERGRYVFQKNLQGQIEMTKEHFRWLLASDKYSYCDANLPQEISHYY